MTVTTTKVCTKCDQELPVEGFYMTKGKPHAWCKPCFREARREYVARNREKVAQTNREQYQKNREERQKYNREYNQRNREQKNAKARERYWNDPERFRALARDWERENPEHRRATKAAYRAGNREKVRGHGNARSARKRAAVSVDVVREILGQECLACGARENLQIEHLIPLCRGGLHSEGNLATLCRSCNASKRELTWTEWKHSSRPRAREVFGYIYK